MLLQCLCGNPCSRESVQKETSDISVASYFAMKYFHFHSKIFLKCMLFQEWFFSVLIRKLELFCTCKIAEHTKFLTGSLKFENVYLRIFAKPFFRRLLIESRHSSAHSKSFDFGTCRGMQFQAFSPKLFNFSLIFEKQVSSFLGLRIFLVTRFSV